MKKARHASGTDAIEFDDMERVGSDGADTVSYGWSRSVRSHAMGIRQLGHSFVLRRSLAAQSS